MPAPLQVRVADVAPWATVAVAASSSSKVPFLSKSIQPISVLSAAPVLVTGTVTL